MNIKSDAPSVEATLQSDLLLVDIQARLKPDSPLLDIRMRVRVRISCKKNHPPVQTNGGLLGIELKADFIDHFEDEEDLFSMVRRSHQARSFGRGVFFFAGTKAQDCFLLRATWTTLLGL